MAEIRTFRKSQWEPVRGTRSGKYARRLAVTFTTPEFTLLTLMAEKNGVSVAEQIRRLCRRGIGGAAVQSKSQARRLAAMNRGA